MIIDFKFKKYLAFNAIPVFLTAQNIFCKVKIIIFMLMNMNGHWSIYLFLALYKVF